MSLFRTCGNCGRILHQHQYMVEPNIYYCQKCFEEKKNAELEPLSQKTLENLMEKMSTLDATEVLDIVFKKGEDWFIELEFKNNKRLFLGSSIAPYFKSKMDPLHASLVDRVPKEKRLFWAVFDPDMEF